MLGALLPGVILVAVFRPDRAMLYWQRTNFCAAGYGELGDYARGGGGALTYDPAYSRGNHVDELLIGGVFGSDQGGCALDNGVYGFEAGCFHRFSGF